MIAETLRRIWKVRKPQPLPTRSARIAANRKEARNIMQNESMLKRVTTPYRADQSLTPTAYPLVFVSADGRSQHTLFLVSDRARQALYTACTVKILAGTLRYHVIKGVA